MAMQNGNFVSGRDSMETAAVVATAGTTKRPVPIAAQMYTVRDYRDSYGKLKRIADIGYRGVELLSLEGYKASELRKVLDDLGLKAIGKFVGLPAAENLNETVDTAKALGFRFVTVTFGPDLWKTTDDIMKTADAVQQGAELLAPHGVQLCYHNHFWEFDLVDGRLPYDTFFSLAPGVLSEMDLYYVRNFGKVDVPPVVKRWAHRIPLMHVKDGPLVHEQNQTAVGAGKMDIPACLQAADPAVLQWAIVELETCDGDFLDALAQSYEYLIGTGLAEGSK